MAPSTTRSSPAGTLPPVVSNVRFANSLMGFLIESARVGPRSRRGMLSTIMEPHSNQPRASWCAANTDTQTTTPLRRCRLTLSLRLSAWHTTRTRRDPRRGPRPRHAIAHIAHARDGTRGGVRGTRRTSYFGFGSSSSRRRRWCVQVTQELAEMPRPTENEEVFLRGLHLGI